VRSGSRQLGRSLCSVCIALLLVLNGCASASHNVSATRTVNAVFTSAYQTFAVQAATRLALTAPTEIPTSTLPPPPVVTTPASAPGAVAASQGACDNNVWIGDVTIPDGTVVAAGTKFVKTWLLQNTGACPWSTGYGLFFSSGDQMGGSDAFLPVAVPAGSQAEFSTALVAPDESGYYTGWWRMKNERGQPFGKVITVAIQVGSSAGCRQPARFGSVTISGHAGPEKVTIDYGDGTVFTDPHGDYSFSVPTGWSGAVRPWKAKVHPWTFDPEQRYYTNVVCDMPDEDYRATAPPGA
jgi:hypothetical protein